MTFLQENLIEALLIIGLILLAIEILVLGFSTFFLFFVGVAALVSAGLMYIEVIPVTFLSALLSVAAFTAFAAVILWRPLKQLQQQVDSGEVEQDFIGHSFVLDSDIDVHQPGAHRYSGIEWTVTCDEAISAGTEVVVTRAEVGKLRVQPKV